MRDDYKMTGPTQNIDVAIEKDLAETLKKMSDHSKHTLAELVNTAVKRFVVTHKDFLPPRRD